MNKPATWQAIAARVALVSEHIVLACGRHRCALAAGTSAGAGVALLALAWLAASETPSAGQEVVPAAPPVAAAPSIPAPPEPRQATVPAPPAVPARAIPAVPTALAQATVPPPAVPRRLSPAPPTWQARAAEPVTLAGRPAIALVIDDVGENIPQSWAAVRMPGRLTVSIFPHARDLAGLTAEARAHGHEVMAHIAMEPRDPEADPGQGVLLTDLAAGALRAQLGEQLDRFSAYPPVAVNNHMGSRFTADPTAMAPVMAELAQRELLFLDSLTAAESVGAATARQAGVTAVVRDTFIDHNKDPAAIEAALDELEAQARRTGTAIGIGHPYPETLAVLRDWIPEMRARGIALVPLSQMAELRHEGRGAELAQPTAPMPDRPPADRTAGEGT